MKAKTLALNNPLSWNELSDIDDLQPFGPDDEPCFLDVRDVLERHGKLGRFGLWLVHNHPFDLADGEVLVEQIDADERTLTTKPVKFADVSDSIVGTQWVLTEGQAVTMAWCRKYCERDWLTGHWKGHNSLPGRIKD